MIVRLTRKRLLALAAVLALAGGAALWLGARGNAGVKVLETARVERGQVRKIIEATGIVKAQVGALVKVGARATGTLSRVYVKVGDAVREGQVLAEIDDRELKARRNEAQARLRLAQAKAELEALNLPRHESLVRQNLEAQSVLDDQVQKAKVSRFEAEAARAALHSLDIQISYTRIVSPMDGVVSEVTAQEGETVVAGLQVANLVTVLDPGRLEMWIYVDETDVGRTRPEHRVEFRVDAYPNRTFKGSVDRIYPQPEIRDNIVYYKALVRVDAEQASPLRPEMTTQCKITVEEKDGALTVPNQALKWVEGRQVVFVREASGVVREVRPKLGLTGAERSEVVEGLNEGEEVATQVVLPGKPKAETKS